MEGLFAKREIGRASFWKKVIKGVGLLMELGKREGAQGNFAFLLPPPSREAEEWEQGAVGAWAGGPGVRRQAGAGEKGRATRGSRPPPRFVSEHGEAAAPRRPAGGGRRCCGARQRLGSEGKWGEG